MNVRYKLNGRIVTKDEWDQRMKEREAIYGNSLSDMLDSHIAPRVMTDDVYFSGVGTLEQQIAEPHHLEHIVKSAKAHGYTPKATDFYRADIAEFPGDPRAFFNHGHGRGEINKRLEEKGMRMDRDGDVTCREPDEDPYKNPKAKLSPRIVKRIKKHKLKENPDLARADQQELEADIVAAHGWNEDR